jgi:hypothetical protein
VTTSLDYEAELGLIIGKDVPNAVNEHLVNILMSI